MERQTLTIGLLGHSISSDNLGVGALTVSNIAIVEKIAMELGVSVQFRVLASLDSGTPYIVDDNVKRVPIRTRAFLSPRRGLFNAVRQCDIVLDITGGDSFADLYGTKRFLRDALSKFIALAARRPLILSPQTIGPFERRWTRWLATRLMRQARAVVTRDRLTTDFLAPFGLRASLFEASDVAFRLPFVRPLRTVGGRARVGINVSGLLFNGGYTRNNMFGLATDYPELVRHLLACFSKEPHCELHLISHVISSTRQIEDDFRLAERLAAEFPDVVVAPRFASPSEAKSYISSLDFFAGSRMHACIAALSSGVPVLPIAYSRKFAGVFGSLGYSVLADCRTETAGQIVEKALHTYREREALRPAIMEALAIAEKKLAAYDTVLRECLSQAITIRQTGN